MSHDPHPLSGKTVHLSSVATDPVREIVVPGAEYRIIDWWDNLGQGSWKDNGHNFACTHYALRATLAGLPLDDEVVYGHIGAYGHIVHVTELGEKSHG
jgi:hypothetical protein